MAGAKDGRLWYCTANTKAVYKELQANPFTQISTSSPDFQWARICGKVQFTQEAAIKKMIYDENPILHGMYKGPEDERFEVFTIVDYEMELSNFSGQQLKATFK